MSGHAPPRQLACRNLRTPDGEKPNGLRATFKKKLLLGEGRSEVSSLQGGGERPQSAIKLQVSSNT